MSARQGKIARLPFAIREELNRRILDGQSGRVILRWLNADPAVKKLLPEDAEGLNVTDSNLTSWRQGGYEDWRKQREHIEFVALEKSKTGDDPPLAAKLSTPLPMLLAKGLFIPVSIVLTPGLFTGMESSPKSYIYK